VSPTPCCATAGTLLANTIANTAANSTINFFLNFSHPPFSQQPRRTAVICSSLT
jgi:hypothetical protein